MDVYDYKNNKTASYTFTKDDNYMYSLESVLNTGGYVIEKYDRKKYHTDSYIVYNKNGKELFNYTNDIYTYLSAKATGIYKAKDGGGLAIKGNSKYAIITADDSGYEAISYIVFDDDTYFGLYDIEVNGRYVIGYPERPDHIKDNNKVTIIDLETKKEIKFEDILEADLAIPDGNTNYFIINTPSNNKDVDYIAYDTTGNKIYSSKGSLYPVNEEYFIEVTYGEKNNSVIKIINAKTKEEKTLNTKGKYKFNTKYNLVTYDYNSNKQWLYKFK